MDWPAPEAAPLPERLFAEGHSRKIDDSTNAGDTRDVNRIAQVQAEKDIVPKGKTNRIGRFRQLTSFPAISQRFAYVP